MSNKDKGCQYCQGELKHLIKHNKIAKPITWDNRQSIRINELYEVENSVMFEVRNGTGYIRLGDPCDMQCLDHQQKSKVNYCPMCGRELGGNNANTI
jgi:ribosomal protein L44E